FSMVLVLAISRVQGVEVLGKYSLMMTVFMLGQNCATFGLPVIITREVARTHTQAGRYLVSASAVAATFLVIAVSVAIGVLHCTMTDIDLRWAVDLILLSLFPSVITLYGEAVLLAFERAGDFVALNLIENTVRAVIGTALIVLGFGIIGIAVALIALRAIA